MKHPWLRSVCWLVCWLGLALLPAKAQPPGYQGRLQVYSLRLMGFPALRGSVNPEHLTGFNLRPEVQVEQVLGRQFSLIGTGGLTRTPLRYAYDGRQGQVRVWGGSAGLGLRSYSFRRRGNIAPLGLYQQLDLHYTLLGLTDLNRFLFPDGRRRLGTRQDLVLALTLGTQRMPLDWLAVQGGVQAAWVWGGLPITDSEREAYLWRQTTARLRGYWALNVFLAVGLLGPRTQGPSGRD